MKKSTKLKLVFALLAAGLLAAQTALTASAEPMSSGSCGENVTWELSGDGTMTISGSGPMYDYNSKTNPAPWFGSAIYKVVVEDEVTRIGKYAFYYCDALREVTLGRNTSSVGEFAFNGCNALNKLTPGDATRTVDSAFFYTDDLTTIQLRDSVTELAATFRDMDSVTSFVVDDTDSTGFYNVNGVLYHRETKDGVETKTLVKVPEGIQLTGTYTPEDDTDIIGEYAFYNQKSLEEVTLPQCTGEIENFAFNGCSALNKFTPGDTTKTVDSAFYSTDLLTTVNLRNSVTELADTFLQMDSVTEFVVDDTDGYGYYSVNGVLYHYDETDDGNIKTLVKVPEGKVLDGSYTAEIGTDVIGEKAFYNQEKLQTVFLPESVTKISFNAFYECDSLTGIYFHGTPPTLGSYAIPSDTTLYYIEGTDGWTDPWEGYDTDVFVPDTPPKGDINGDSDVDENDSDALKRYFAGWLKRFSDLIDNFRDYKEETEKNPYDINNDGVFNARDLMLLVRYLANWEGYDRYFKDKAN